VSSGEDIVSAKKTATKKKAATKKTAAKKPATEKATPRQRSSDKAQLPGPGDVIVVDSMKVGSPSREGEVLEVIRGQVTVSYRVQWTDGHQTVLTPSGGNARVVRASGRG
jgi:sRNA-binding protein